MIPHRWRKACAFLIRPGNHFDRVFGFNLMFMQGFKYFYSGQYTVDSIVLASGWLRL